MVEALESFRAFLVEPLTPATAPYEQPARDPVADRARRVRAGREGGGDRDEVARIRGHVGGDGRAARPELAVVDADGAKRGDRDRVAIRGSAGSDELGGSPLSPAGAEPSDAPPHAARPSVANRTAIRILGIEVSPPIP